MAYKSLEDKKAYHKKYYENNKEKLSKRDKKQKRNRIQQMSEEEKQAFLSERRRIRREYYCKNKEHIQAQNKEKAHLIKLKSHYGITIEDYNEILKRQNDRCAICKCDEDKNVGRKTKLPFHVDHCHTTGNVRGLLCHNCNIMLGHGKDSLEILENAIKYLKENGTN